MRFVNVVTTLSFSWMTINYFFNFPNQEISFLQSEIAFLATSIPCPVLTWVNNDKQSLELVYHLNYNFHLHSKPCDNAKQPSLFFSVNRIFSRCFGNYSIAAQYLVWLKSVFIIILQFYGLHIELFTRLSGSSAVRYYFFSAFCCQLLGYPHIAEISQFCHLLKSRNVCAWACKLFLSLLFF